MLKSKTKFQRVDRFLYERQWICAGGGALAGVDEAGRGPLAGPVVAAAVILSHSWAATGVPSDFRRLTDSKQLSAAERALFFDRITSELGIRFALGCCGPEAIDRINILQATYQAMNQALEKLADSGEVAHALVDGRPVPVLRVPQTALIKGDSLSYSIAAASVLAKVTRDRLMLKAHQQWPNYGFDEHKGYPTAGHLEALRRLGPCPIHRLSFAPLKQPPPELFR
ncbi:MAG: ribonuclease HII [Pedosphaera sp.]|nr:ribonuclease HII [Pedosphaera sp.]